jgi:hypothetical protein
MRGAKAAFTVLFAVALAVASVAAVGAAGAENEPATAKGSSNVYIVRMLEPPVVAYEGGIAGLAATKPAKGTKIDPDDQKVVRYVGYLDSRHNDVLGKVGGRKVYDYRYTFNGFAAQLTPGQVARAKADPGVLTVEKAEEVTMDTATTPAFLGLTDATEGLWTAPRNIKGENIVIGVVDSGIWPESKSFSDRQNFGTTGARTYENLPGFKGKCASTETVTDGSWDANLCNRKLVAAQFF